MQGKHTPRKTKMSDRSRAATVREKAEQARKVHRAARKVQASS